MRRHPPSDPDQTLGGYAPAELDEALRRSQRSDPVTVVFRLLGIVVVYVLLARAILGGLGGAGLLLPLLVEALAVLWLGGVLALTVVPCPAFRASAGRGPGIVIASLVLLAAGCGLLYAVPELRGANGIDPAAVWPWLHRHQLHWALLAVVAGLVLTTANEVLAWRLRGGVQGGVFVWTGLGFMATRFGLVILLGLVLGVSLALFAGALHERIEGSAWLARLAANQWAWAVWGALLLLDLSTLAVLALMHRDLSKMPVHPPEPTPCRSTDSSSS